MGELTSIIDLIKKDKNQFYIIHNKMKPLIDKYCRILYKDDCDDVHSELTLSLWEAVNKISSYDNDAQTINYLKNALTNKFHELYRTSRKNNDNETLVSNDELYNFKNSNNHLKNIVINVDINNFIKQFYGTKKTVFIYILIYDLSDSEISAIMDISRQYVHRMRQNLRILLFEYFENN